MAKTNMKAEMMAMVAAQAKSFNEEKNVYEMTEAAFNGVVAQLNEKFVVKTNDKNARAIAYASKKSENLVLIKIVADEPVKAAKVKKPAAKKVASAKTEKAAKAEKTSKPESKKAKAAKEPKFKLTYEMGKDTGMNVHFCEFEMTNADMVQMRQFLELVSEKFAEIFGAASEIKYDGVDKSEDANGFSGKIVFAKIKGHSKDGYAAYKKAMTEAKAAMK